MEMGLQECADRIIGNWHLRGISGGEKRRLSIALEILTRPTLLFLDEPTTGLDSASAYFVAQTLRNLAHDAKTVISSIHQPSSEEEVSLSTAEIKATLIEKYRWSEYATTSRERIKEISNMVRSP
ncbi:hypothetical protein V8G54_022514 [Vigna mungo]|uniref:ABC transporter domain-containing protein n=1 Tax=Vigna mungo TaxID=3915 RepID=A0AAQ3N3J4_VIGMU